MMAESEINVVAVAVGKAAGKVRYHDQVRHTWPGNGKFTATVTVQQVANNC